MTDPKLTPREPPPTVEADATPELLKAVRSVIAWYEAEDDHSKADFYQRLEMCRESEALCRAAIAKAEGHPAAQQPAALPESKPKGRAKPAQMTPEQALAASVH